MIRPSMRCHIGKHNLWITNGCALSLDGDRAYASLLRNIHSTSIDLTILRTTWMTVVLRVFGDRIERVNGRLVLIADDKKIAKSGKNVKLIKLGANAGHDAGIRRHEH